MFSIGYVLSFKIGAEGGNRTRTVLLPLDFESSASASSTTSAWFNLAYLKSLSHNIYKFKNKFIIYYVRLLIS